VTHKGNISAYDYNDEDSSSKLMTDKDKDFIDKSQHAGVDVSLSVISFELLSSSL
jgi:aureolysin